MKRNLLLLLVACGTQGPIATRIPAIDPVIPSTRRVTWSPGIPGGIPHRTSLCAAANVTAYGDGIADATAPLQALIDACPADQVVLVPAGTYRLTAALRLSRAVVLRGEGPARTRLVLSNDAERSVIEMGRKDVQGPGVAVLSGYEKGSTELTVADGSSFSVGDVVLLDEDPDPDLASGGPCPWYARDARSRPIGQRLEVIGKAGDTLQLGSELHLTYRAVLHPEVSKGPQLSGLGVEDLFLERTGDFRDQGWMILMANVSRSWVRNIETHKVSGAHVELIACHRCVVADSFFHHAWNYGPFGQAYGVRLTGHTSESLVENNALYFLNVPLTLVGTGGGNAIAYNYSGDAQVAGASDFQSPDFTSSCVLPHMELLEGNWLPHVLIDDTDGNSAYLTLFRNHLTARRRTLPDAANVAALQIARGGWYLNVVANVLLSEGQGGVYEGDGSQAGPVAFELNADPRVRATLVREGNFDWATGQVSWESPMPVHSLPASLYLAAKPGFWGDRPWPMVDPDRTPRVGTLPAKDRFDALNRTGAW